LVAVPPPVVGVPPPEGVVVAPAAVVVPAEGVVAEPAEVVVPPVVADAVADVVVVELELELEVELDAATAASAAEVGTVNGGAPETSGVDEPPPPQAVRPTLSVSAARAAGRRVQRRTRGSGMPTERQEPRGSMRRPQ
jgi:hypothetical protein